MPGRRSTQSRCRSGHHGEGRTAGLRGGRCPMRGRFLVFPADGSRETVFPGSTSTAFSQRNR
ncbi:Hypothetical protein I596_254 [Dokdonella koreensis DS-123]|uniref:Uncharacterized protein n=1 Tax=Dokdonella koreensis DS-123 TaxID=1300342 RepID=A0A167G9A7_9GAMM|nr:Hypothetical protein I596_254 [Dokdonella koreensis DS-123]